MKLADLETFVVGTPPPGYGGRYFLFVKLTTACGIVGYGEVYAGSLAPDVMEAVVGDVFARHMAGRDPHDVEAMFRSVYSAGFSQRPDPTVIGAFSGLEIACWDILGQAHDLPAYKLLGGEITTRIRTYSYLYPGEGDEDAEFYASPERSAAQAAKMVEEGFTAIKFDPAGPYTIMGGHMPFMEDLARSTAFCSALREAVGDRADLLFGTHGQFTPGGAKRMAQAIAPYQPLWFEEPVPPDTPSAMAEVAKASPVPIAAGERLCTRWEFQPLLAAGAVQIVQPALGRVGGLWEARKLAVLAEAHGAQVAPHLYAGPIEWAANLQLAACIPNFLIAETILKGGGFHAELLDVPLAWEDGHVMLSERPGLGVRLNEDVARAHPYTGDRLHLEMQPKPHGQNAQGFAQG
ncbi:MAG: mandelate racemase/muconate lactonizing enzyme family protein [Pseudomonadota bacterium]